MWRWAAPTSIAISKSAPAYYGQGYIYAGIQAPLVESRGKVVLLVDNTFTSSLSNELARLQQDLVGDGWTVLRHDVPRMAVDPANTNSSVWAARSNELASVKALIKADYNADPANVKAVFLVRPRARALFRRLAPDDHSDHTGAWPADAYYGDMDGTWTDSSLNDHAPATRGTGTCPATANSTRADSALRRLELAGGPGGFCEPAGLFRKRDRTAAPVPEQGP